MPYSNTIERASDGFATRLFDRRCGFLQRRYPASGHDDRRAFLSQQDRGLPPDTRAGARNERNLSVDGDPDQLFRVLLNLVRNAAQALEGNPDPASMQIRVTGRREGAVAILEVSDTGPGVPQKTREHLFEAFQTSGRPGGSGLGLAIAAELVRAHGGNIQLVEGTIGATFRIVIPDRPVELLSIRNERARA